MTQKQFTIQINGIKESVDAVESLNKKLDTLEQRIEKVDNTSIDIDQNVSKQNQALQILSKQGEVERENISIQRTALDIADQLLGTYNQNISLLSDYSNQLKQITQERKKINKMEESGLISQQKADEQRASILQREQEIKAAKQEISRIVANEQKMMQAEEGSYNQMSAALTRMKEALKSVKVGDLGDDQFKTLSSTINDLDQKLKNSAASMGEYQRNVGNYAIAGESLKGFVVQIGDAEKSFSSMREALKELKQEMANLDTSTADGKQKWQDYNGAILQIKDKMDAMKDSSMGLHSALETVQGVISIMSVGKGLAGFFGIDEGTIQRSIQQVTSLMAVLQGLNELNNQIKSGTGIGATISKIMNVSGITSDWQKLKDLGAAMVTQIKSIGEGAKVSAVGVNLLSLSVKGLATAFKTLGKATIILAALQLAIEGIAWVIDKIKGLFSSSNKETEKMAEAQKKLASSIADAGAEQISTFSRLASAWRQLRTEQQKRDFITKNKDAIEGFTGACKDLYGAFDSLVKKSPEVISALASIAVADAYKQRITDRAKELLQTFNTFLQFPNDKIREKTAQAINSMLTPEIENYEYFSTIAATKAKNAGLNMGGGNKTTTKSTTKSTSLDTGSAENQASKLLDIQKQLRDNRIAVMKDGLDKEMALLDAHYQDEVRAAGNNQQLIQSIEAKYSKQRLDVWNRYKTEVMNIHNEIVNNLKTQMRELDKEAANAEIELQELLLANKEEGIQRKGILNGAEVDQATLDARLAAYKLMYDELEKIRKADLENEIQQAKAGYDNYVKQINQEYEMRIAGAKTTGEDVSKITADYNQHLEQAEQIHLNAISAAQLKAVNTQEKNLQEHLKKDSEAYKDYYENVVGSASSLEQLGKLGELALQQFKAGLMDADTYKEIKEFIGNKAEEITEDTKKKSDEQLEKIYKTIGEVLQYMSQLSGVLFDFWNNSLEAEMDALEKQTELLEKEYSKQEEITQKHTDTINSLEDELQNARGDRRQFIIDQLNEQMQAQQESLQKEQELAAEKEKLEKKQDALELKRKKAQKAQDLVTAGINTALAITGVLAQQPGGLISRTVAAAIIGAIGAAQIAVIASKKYAKGGLLEGKSHAQGGIPVGNTGIEVEGKEYIVNKKTTGKNLQLMNYINSKDKRFTLDDFIQFYKGAKIPKYSPRAKFAEGGQLPTLRNIDISDQMRQVVVDDSKRQYVVSVVDINKKQRDVRNIQVLAGIKQ